METKSKDVTTVQPWIEIKIGTNNQIVGFDEFVKEMESLGSVHIRQKWYQAACSGLEIDLVIKVGEWLALTWIGGKVFKWIEAGEDRLMESLNKLLSKNEEDMEFQSLSIEYDDTTIRFIGLSAGKVATLGEFFNALYANVEWLNQHGIKNIDSISLPIYGDDLEQLEDRDETLTDYNNWGADYFRIWKISYDFGCNKTFYDSMQQRLL